MDIRVELTPSEWDHLCHLMDQKNNEFICEEEYVDLLMSVIGHKIRTRPVEGDNLILMIRPSIWSMPEGKPN